MNPNSRQHVSSNSTLPPQPLWTRILLLFVLAYEGLGGQAGGILLMMKSDGSLMDMPVELMNGVFKDFLIPGIILFFMGTLNIWAFISVLRKKSNDWFMAGLALGGYFIWFVTEIIILRELHWLHAMWGTPILAGIMAYIPLIAARFQGASVIKILLDCGIVSSFWYIAINALVPMFYQGYSISDLTISELSAIGAPTRIFWVLIVTLYLLLFSAFGWGVWMSSGDNRKLRIAGVLLLIYSFINMYWPPMHMRGNEPTLTDTLHIVWAGVTVLLMIVIMSFAAAALDKKFKWFTIASLILLMVFGSLTSMTAPNIPTNGPTPFIGVWERINIGIFLLWVIVFANRISKRVLTISI